MEVSARQESGLRRAQAAGMKKPVCEHWTRNRCEERVWHEGPGRP